MSGFAFGRRALFVASAAITATACLPALAADDQAVIAPIQQLNNGLLEIMKEGPHSSFQQRFDTLAPIIDQTFDLPFILQESVGLIWPTLQPEQQQMLMTAFRRYTVASYVNSFDAYNGQRFEVSPQVRTVGNGEQVVDTRIIPRSGSGHRLDYVMRQTPQGWRVVDVLADGSISRVAVQRSDFHHLLTRGGPNALAERLRTKTADLSEGTG